MTATYFYILAGFSLICAWGTLIFTGRLDYCILGGVVAILCLQVAMHEDRKDKP